jgi:phosphohistidine phosphatase
VRTLLLLRHAKSSWDEPGLRDHDRPLNARGERTAPRMGRLLVEEELVPDLVLSSTAVRARRTAELVLEATGGEAEIAFVESLYLASPRAMLETVARRGGDAERVLIVAHNPGCAELVSHVADDDEDFPTAALARIDFDVRNWSDVELEAPSRLVGLWRPKELNE